MTKFTTVRLADIASVNPKPANRPAAHELISFVPMSAVDAETGATDSGEDRAFAEVSKGYTLFTHRDILVAKITPCFENGKIAQALLRRNVGVGSTEFHVIRPDRSQLDARYLLHFLRRPAVRAAGELRMTGSGGQRRVPEAFLADLCILLPPIAEQRRVAETLDQVDELRAKRRQAVAYLHDVAQSIFLDMFGNRSDCKGWDQSHFLGEVAEVTSGITKGRKTTALDLRPVPYLAVLNVQDKRLKLSTVKQIEATEEEIKRYRLQKNDLLLTEGGDPDKLGRGSLWNDELPEAIHQNHIFRVRITAKDRVNPVYLNWHVSSERGKQYFLRSAKQTTGIASINKSQLRQFPLMLPPLKEQERFAEQMAAVQQLKARHEASLAELDALFASLQDRAFRRVALV